MKFERIIPLCVKRGAKKALLLLIPLLMIILVTAGTGEPSRASVNNLRSVDELRGILDRLDEASAVISDQLISSPRDYDWDIAELVETVALVESIYQEELGEPIANRVARLSLEGIAWNEANPVAFVSQEVLTLNAMIEGLQVTHIGLESVVLSDESGHTQEMRLNQ